MRTKMRNQMSEPRAELKPSGNIQLQWPFLAVHGVLKARILKWFAIPSATGSCSVRTLHHNPSILGGPTRHGSKFHWVRQGCGPCTWSVCLVFVVFILFVLWWLRIRGLWKLPDGRDWLRGNWVLFWWQAIKDRNGMDLTEAEDIKKKWQEYTEKLYKKDLHDPDNHDGVITHLEPDILECEVKWALGSITMNKATGGDGIPVELFQILKDDAVKVLHSICQQIWKTQQWPKDWKRSVFIPIPKKGNTKECSNYHTIALISHTSKVMLKILQARLQ